MALAYRAIDVWEYRLVPEGWVAVPVEAIPTNPPVPQPALMDDANAEFALDSTFLQLYGRGRIYRLWTWDGSRWTLTEQRQWHS